MLLGAGAAHIEVLQDFARERPAGVEALLVAPGAETLPAGSLPGLVSGRDDPARLTVALPPLAAAAGVALVAGSVAGVDARSRVVRLADGRLAEYELLSIDGGAAQARDQLPGAREHALFVRPTEAFTRLLPAVLSMSQQRVLDLVVVGGGAEAFELALAFAVRLSAQGVERARVALVAGAEGPLPGWPAAAQRAGAQALARRRITVFREPAAALRPGAVVLASGARLACDVPVLAGGIGAPEWLAGSGLALRLQGGLQTGPTLQSVSHPEVFAAGEAPAGEGRALAENLRRAAGGGLLQPWAARARALRWLSCGDRRAIAVWRGLAATIPSV